LLGKKIYVDSTERRSFPHAGGRGGRLTPGVPASDDDTIEELLEFRVHALSEKRIHSSRAHPEKLYLPMQKREKISPSRSSTEVSPVISPSLARPACRSTRTNSSDNPSPSAAAARQSAWRVASRQRAWRRFVTTKSSR